MLQHTTSREGYYVIVGKSIWWLLTGAQEDYLVGDKKWTHLNSYIAWMHALSWQWHESASLPTTLSSHYVISLMWMCLKSLTMVNDSVQCPVAGWLPR